MRTQSEVLSRLLDFAQSDENVRAVVMNGSRLNPNAPKDILQDYDVVFFVGDLSFAGHRRDRAWIAQFGELVMLQQNDFDDGSFIFLMQFDDGVRIDLYFQAIERLSDAAGEDSLTRILLDKDGAAGPVPEPDDSGYFVRMPTRREWDETLNELWWIQIYIAKEIWRDELPFAKHLYDADLVECLRRLLEWRIGHGHGWRVNAGKCGKWFKRLLDRQTYEEFASVYCGADYQDMWAGLMRAGALIRRVGVPLAEALGYPYPLEDDRNTTVFLKKMRSLPSGAQTF